MEYPYANDTFDEPVGKPWVVVLPEGIECSGIIAVGYEVPLADHAVACRAFGKALRHRREIPAAIWFDGETAVQLSELYRP